MKGPSHSGQIRKGLVYGVLFHLWGEAPHDVEEAAGKQAVRFIIGWKNDQPRTKGLCFMQGNTALDSQLLGSVIGTSYDPAFSACDQRFSLELRIMTSSQEAKKASPSTWTMARGHE